MSRLRLPFVILAAAIAYGVAGYMWIEGFPAFDALYMTVITLTTVGFTEVHPLSNAGRAFTMTVLFFGLGALVTAVSVVAELLVSGELGYSLRRRRMESQIDRLKDHYIICAYGRVGRAVAEEFREMGIPFLAIDVKEDLIALLQEHEVPFIIGDPAEEAILSRAGIERAKGLVCAVDSDAVNVFITLTARRLNPELTIVARAGSPETEDKLMAAGAHRVISPYVLSGKRMAFQVLRPSVVEFVDLVTLAPDLRLEEIRIGEDSHLVGRTVGQAEVTHPGINILALRNTEGTLEASPRKDAELHAGDLVIALGPTASLNDMAD